MDDGAQQASDASEASEASEVHAVPDTRAAAQRRWWWVGLVALAGLVIVTIVVFASGGDGGDDETADGASTTAPGAAVSGSSPVTDGVAGTVVVDASTSVAPGSSAPVAPGSSVDAAATGTTVAGATTTTLIGATSVPPPAVSFVPGNGDTVPVQTVVTAPPVAIDDVADPGTGMSFRLDRLEAVQGEANGPGEIAGPAVRVTVAAANDTGAPVLLETIVVDLVYGSDRTSAAPLSGPGAVRFSGELTQGASATGVYVFDVPVDQRDEVSVIVSYTAAVSPVVFTGPAPRP
jgi:hypothetical protein